MPAQNLQKIEWTTLQEFISKINANFAIIQNSPLFKGIPGESIQGDVGPEGRRGGKFLFVKYSPNFVNAFNLSGGSTNDIDADWLTNHSDENNIQNLLTALETNDLIDGDVIVLESTTELVKVTVGDLEELVFTPTGVYLSQEIAAFNQLQTLYDNTLALLESFDIEQNVVIDRFKTIALSFGYPSSANIQNPNLEQSSVFYPFIDGISDYYNSGVDVTENGGVYSHFYYSLAREKYNNVNNYTFVSGKIQDLVTVLDNTQQFESQSGSTSLYHLPTRDFLPSHIILQNTNKEGLLIGNKSSVEQMNNFSRMFKNALHELVITSKYEHDTSIDGGVINSNNYHNFNYGMLIIGEQQMIWNKKFTNYGTLDLIGDFVQSLYRDINNTEYTVFDTPFLRTRTAALSTQNNPTHIEIGFFEGNTLFPYSQSLTSIFSDNIRLVDHNQSNGFANIFLFTDSNGNIRKDIFKESIFGSDVEKFSDDMWEGNGNYNMTVFLDAMERTDNDKQVITSDYIAALTRLLAGVEGDGAQRPFNLNIRNFDHTWLMEDFAPVYENYHGGKNTQEQTNDTNGWFGYERIESLELNKNLIIGKKSSHLSNNRNHKGDEIFRVLQGNKTGYNKDVIVIGNINKSFIPNEYLTTDLLLNSAVNDISQNSFDDASDIFMKWKKLYMPGLKPRTILSVDNSENYQYGFVQTTMQFADYTDATNSGSYTQAQINAQTAEPSEVTEKGLLSFVDDNLDDENVSFEIAFALKLTDSTSNQTNSYHQDAVNKYSGGGEHQPFRKKLLTGSHWRILWGAFDRLRNYIKSNFYKKEEIDEFVAPIGSIVAWTPIQVQNDNQALVTPTVRIPKGWVPCFGGTATIIENGIQKTVVVPDLINKFVLGEYVSKYYVDNNTMRVVCNGGLISSNKYGGRNYTFLEEKHIPPHIHQHTHDNKGHIRAKVLVTWKNNLDGTSPAGQGNINSWLHDHIRIANIAFDAHNYTDGDYPYIGMFTSSVESFSNTRVSNNSNGTTNPRSRYPREWSNNQRNNRSIPPTIEQEEGFSSIKLVNNGLSPEPYQGSSVDGIMMRPANGNLWEGVFGGESDGSKRVQQKLDLVSRHIKLIYIYKVGLNLVDYNHSTIYNNNNQYPISKTTNFDNIQNNTQRSEIITGISQVGG